MVDNLLVLKNYICISGVFIPVKCTTSKYSVNVKGGYTAASFSNYRLPVSVIQAIVGASNQSLAKTTWDSYRTAEAHIKRCEEETGVRIRFPMDNRMTLTYVGWLISRRKVSSTTISQYLSALRVVHLKHGVLPSNLRPDIVQAIIEGKVQLALCKLSGVAT